MTVNDMNDDQVVNLFSDWEGLYRTLSEKKYQASLFVRVFKVFHKIRIDWYHVNSLPRSVNFGVRGTGAIAIRKYGRLSASEGDIYIKLGDRRIDNPFSKYLLDLIYKNDDNDNQSKIIEGDGVLLTEEIVNFIEKGFDDPNKYSDFVVGDAMYPNSNGDIGKDNSSSQNLPKVAPDIKQASNAEPVLEIFYGPPGTGKTRKLITTINEFYDERARFVTFHQSYGYEEFVEGLKPVLLKEGDDSNMPLQYQIVPGVFKKLCEDAEKSANAGSQDRFAIVIDEINRGNISKIFGELITLIEPNKRIGGSEYVAVTLPYSGEVFGVPSNVDVYGSMNTADRSLALLDTALRRRFNFKAFYPDAALLKKVNVLDSKGTDLGIDLYSMLNVINRRIEVLYDRDHTIGHGYFLTECISNTLNFDDLVRIFETKIIPLLEEYFFEDNSKIALVLGDGTKKVGSQSRFYTKNSINFDQLFGPGIENETGSDKDTYTLNAKALKDPNTYIGIYSTTGVNDQTAEASDVS